jgi:hypothetical protein
MSKAFEEAVRGTPAIKTVNIYFHRRHAEAAQELGARITADAAGQAFATRTQGDLVKSLNDVAACDAIMVDTALGDAQIAVIVELHDRFVNRPYEVHRIAYDTRTKVFDIVKEAERVQAPQDSAPSVPTATAGSADDFGPRPADPPDAVDGLPASRDQRARRRAGGGTAG